MSWRRLSACSLAGLSVAAAVYPAAAPAQDGRVSVRAGVERISGDYGGDVALQDLYVPISALFERGRLAFRATIPYLEVEFFDPVSGTPYTESGLGDVVLGVSVYDIGATSGSAWSADVTMKVELGTGDEARGLGNGATDYTVLTDVRRALERGALIASVGYKVRGEPARIDLEDGWLVALGAVRHFSAATSGSLFFDYRQASTAQFEALRELTATLSRRLSNDWRVQGHLVKGFGDTGLDIGAGFSVRRDF